MTKDQLKNIYLRTCKNQAFELNCAKAHTNKQIISPIYLSLGQEHIPAMLAELFQQWPLFPQHRCHSYALSWGMSEESIAKEILGRTDGCNGGYGGSPSLSSKNLQIFGHSGLLGDQVPIAAGYALATNKPTICIIGDAAAEEDYVLATLGFIATKKIPLLIICEDNNLSILTQKHIRRSWDISIVARAFGLYSLSFVDNDFDIIMNYLSQIKLFLPAFINLSTIRKLWHCGSGCDGTPSRDSFLELENLAIQNHGEKILNDKFEIFKNMEKLWSELAK